MTVTFTRQRSSSVTSISSNRSLTPSNNNINSGTFTHSSAPTPTPTPTSQPLHLPPLSMSNGSDQNPQHVLPSQITPPLLMIPTSGPTISEPTTRTTTTTATATTTTNTNTNADTNTNTSTATLPSTNVAPQLPSLLSTSTSTSNTSTTPVLPATNPTPTSVRSMSIVSLDRSPRNSIVSTDDNLRSHTRNNSTTSLASLTSHPVAVHGLSSVNLAHPLNPLHVHHKQMSNGSAIISDDDSELDQTTPSRTILKPIRRLKRRSNSNDPINRDFKLKFDDRSVHHINQQQQQQPTSPTLMTTNPQSLNASPTSVSLSRFQDLAPITISNSSNNTNPPLDSKNLKKLKSTNLIQQSMYIKRKLAISKDLQIEYFNSVSHNNNNSIHSLATTTPSSSPPLPPPLSPPSISSELLDSKFFPPLPLALMPRKSTASPPIPMSLIPPNQPILQTLQEQNELIIKLNRRWNKASVNESNKGKQQHLKPDTPGSPISAGLIINTNANTRATNTTTTNTTMLPPSSNNSATISNTTMTSRKRSRQVLLDEDYEYHSYDDYNYDSYDD